MCTDSLPYNNVLRKEAGRYQTVAGVSGYSQWICPNGSDGAPSVIPVRLIYLRWTRPSGTRTLLLPHRPEQLGINRQTKKIPKA